MINKLSKQFLALFATNRQDKAINRLSGSDYDPNFDRLGGKFKADIFEGDFDNFKNTPLADLFNKKELKALFNLIDRDGDGEISGKEINELAKLGNGGSKKRIDDSDINNLMKTINKLADDKLNDLGDIDSAVEITKKYNEDGELISLSKTDDEGNSLKIKYSDGKKVKMVKSNADGSTEVVKYDKKGRRKSSLVIDEDGKRIFTRYEYGRKKSHIHR